MAGTNMNRAGSNPKADSDAQDQSHDTAGATSSDMEGDRPNDEASPLPTAVQEHLGRQLRAAYSALVNEPIPDKLAELLRKLESKQRELE